MSEFVVVIPARLASSRLPRKALADIAGKPMVAHTYLRACQSHAKVVYVATDSMDIQEALKPYHAKVYLTGDHHETGTQRVAEVVEQLQLANDTIIVNVQGDEPLIDPRNINQVADTLANTNVAMATLSTPLSHAEELYNPNTVKVVTNHEGKALYFSRATIPWWRGVFDGKSNVDLPSGIPYPIQHHIGIFAYRAGFLRMFTKLAPSPLETMEALEQLRALWYGYGIQVAVAEVPCLPGVDTEQDLARIRSIALTKP